MTRGGDEPDWDALYRWMARESHERLGRELTPDQVRELLDVDRRNLVRLRLRLRPRPPPHAAGVYGPPGRARVAGEVAGRICSAPLCLPRIPSFWSCDDLRPVAYLRVDA